MKNTSYLTHANIHNLTSLWKTVSLPLKSYQNTSRFSYSEIWQSDWPNRLWFNPDVDVIPGSAEKAREIISSGSAKLALIYWDIFSSNSWRYVEKEGFQKQSELTGMSLKLSKPFCHQNRLELKRVKKPDETSLWEEIYLRAFGYRISRNVLKNSLDNIEYYLAVHNSRPAGTAIVFHTGDITGIHGVGIVPEMRRKGIAEEMMKMILNKSRKTGHNYATLQASKMGRGMYLKLGFEDLFIMKNYYLDSAQQNIENF